MPRPSDLYATSGAPGMYQATSTHCVPYQLPCVYVFPPEEDNENALCLFHAGSALPTSYQSFYDVPDEDPFSSNYTDSERGLRRRNPRITYRAHTWRAPQVATTSRGSGSSSSSASTSSLDSMAGQSDEATVYPNQPSDEDISDYLDQGHVPIRPASRRSSVFGDRPSDHEPPKLGGQDEISQTGICRSQTLSMSIKNKAATALKVMGGPRTRRKEGDLKRVENAREQAVDSGPDPTTYDSWFESEPPPPPQRRKSTRGAFALLFNSKSSTSALSPTEAVKSLRPLPPASNKNIGRRKSVSQMLRFNRDKPIATRGNESGSPTDVTPVASASSTSLVLSDQDYKLSKPKSMSQLFGRGQGLSKSPSATSIVSITDPEATSHKKSNNDSQNKTSTPSGPHPAPPQPQSLSHFGRSGSPVSLASEASTTRPTKRRASFLNGHIFSFRQLQRHFTHNQIPSVPLDNNTPIERVSSSDSTEVSSEGQHSTPTSTDSETGEDEPQSPITVDIPTIIVGEDCIQDQMQSDVTPKLMPTDIEEDFDFAARFGLRVDNGGRATDSPILELAVQLNSLDFDRLAFDPETFTNPAYDD